MRKALRPERSLSVASRAKREYEFTSAQRANVRAREAKEAGKEGSRITGRPPVYLMTMFVTAWKVEVS